MIMKGNGSRILGKTMHLINTKEVVDQIESNTEKRDGYAIFTIIFI